MRTITAAVSATALLVASHTGAEPVRFDFTQDDWSNGGSFSGFFEAEDLNSDGIITHTFGIDVQSEVTAFEGTFASDNINTSFTLDDLSIGFDEVFPVFDEDFERNDGIAFGPSFEDDFPFEIPGGLVFALNGDGLLGDDSSPVPETLSLRNDDFTLNVGVGAFGGCGGDQLCGEIFAPAVFDQGEEGFIPGAEAFVATPLIVTGPIADVNGNFENLPLLPDSIEDGRFEFDLSDIENLPGRITFFDPEIAVGYTYEVVGNEFTAVQGPELTTVNDPDGYIVTVITPTGVEEFTLTAGPAGLLVFSEVGLTGVTSFTITGINPDLSLDPTDAQAFVTGLAFADLFGAGQTLTQTPITVQTTPAVPLPAGGVLLLTGFAGLAAMRRRRRNA